MRKNKLIIIILCFVFLFILNVNTVQAEEIMTDEDCKECALKNGGRCGYCRACAEVNGECVVNKHDKELWTAEECAENASSETDCNKCSGYVWSSNKCVTKASLDDSEKKSESEKNEEQNKEETRRPKVTCGKITGIPKVIPRITSLVVTIIQIAVPILLVIFGSVDLFKGITAGKDDEMKKGQKMFIKRLVIASIIFFIVVIVKLLISIVAESTSNNIDDCIECFIGNDCGEE